MPAMADYVLSEDEASSVEEPEVIVELPERLAVFE